MAAHTHTHKTGPLLMRQTGVGRAAPRHVVDLLLKCHAAHFVSFCLVSHARMWASMHPSGRLVVADKPLPSRLPQRGVRWPFRCFCSPIPATNRCRWLGPKCVATCVAAVRSSDAPNSPCAPHQRRHGGQIGGGAPSDGTTHHKTRPAGGQPGQCGFRAHHHKGAGVGAPIGRELGLRGTRCSAMPLEPAVISRSRAMNHKSCHAGQETCRHLDNPLSHIPGSA